MLLNLSISTPLYLCLHHPRLSDRLSGTLLVGSHPLPSGTPSTREEHAQSQTEHQRDHHHDEGAREPWLGGHQEDNAQQQSSHCLQHCQGDGVVGAQLKRLRQWAVWCFSCQAVDSPPAWLDERCSQWGYENQADQVVVNPVGLEVPGGECHVEPCDEDEQHADLEEGA